ncbi:hypothetical protein SeMB42_g05006 [Synchytrium endobioticum]|uniref:Histidine kinase n=1 Tax=Synchytrium endobioticum TaxID=286115 RepID=A0A507CUD7_9FUNG|nr:hypothetical protein SeLEV6574_g05591 [Synchytrium endobioticum]TPX42746.1 hypothetical protein SeMB42_g05006 [Synchytrium endobioticum]
MVSAGISVLANCTLLALWINTPHIIDQSTIALTQYSIISSSSIRHTHAVPMARHSTEQTIDHLYSGTLRFHPTSPAGYVIAYQSQNQTYHYPDNGDHLQLDSCASADCIKMSNEELSSQPLALISAISDALITVAYFSIPIELLCFVIKAQEVPFPGITILFVLFITLCGITHLIGAFMPWLKAHFLAAIARVLTALVSLFTALVLFFTIPQALSLPKYVKLVETEIAQRQRAEQILRGEFDHMKLFRDIVHNLRQPLSTPNINLKSEILARAAYEIASKLEGARRCLIYTPNRNMMLECVAEHILTDPPLPRHSLDISDEEAEAEDIRGFTSEEEVRLMVNACTNGLHISSSSATSTTASLLSASMPDVNVNLLQHVFKGKTRSVLVVSHENSDLSRHLGIAHDEKAIIAPMSLPNERTGFLVFISRHVPKLALEEETGFGTSSLLLDLAEQITIAKLEASMVEKDRLLIAQLEEQNVALMQARKEVKVAQAQKDFTAVMSHEMRTPLFAISSLLSMLLDMKVVQESQFEEVLEMLELAKKSAQMLVTIVNNILDFSKYEDENFNLDRSPFIIRDALEMAADVVAVQDHDGKFPQIVLICGHDVPKILVGDVTRFRQILVNLLANGCKFTESTGSVTLEVQTTPSTRAGKVVLRIDVTDTGIGIRPEDVSKLFQKFSQADASHTRRYGGTGLGLAIAKTLCNYMGGTITVRPNQQERGTQFAVSLYLDEYYEHEWDIPVSLQTVLPDSSYDNLVLSIIDGNPDTLRGLEHLALYCSPKMVVHAFKNISEFLSSNIPVHGVIVNTLYNEKEMLVTLTNSGLSHRCFILYGFTVYRCQTESPVSKNSAASTAQRPLKVAEFARWLDFIIGRPPITFSEETLLTFDEGDDELHAHSRTDGRRLKRNGVMRNQAAGGSAEKVNDVVGANDSASMGLISPTQLPLLTSCMGPTAGGSLLLPPLKILVVEDNVINQLVITKMLGRLGFKTTDLAIANDGIEALEKIGNDEGKYDVVLMDIMMPRMDGYECTKAIRAKLGFTDKPWIVGLTANAFWDDKVRCREVGMQDFVPKPATIADVWAALKRFCDQPELPAS